MPQANTRKTTVRKKPRRTLELFEGDLTPDYRSNATAAIHFHHFNRRAQAALMAAREGVFYRNKGTIHENSKTIQAPSQTK